MLINTVCSCGSHNQSDISPNWIKDKLVLIQCDKCNNVYMASINVEIETFNKDESDEPKEEKTNLNIDEKVIIKNEQHDLNNKIGIIVDKDHLHYKVQFKDGLSVWLPYHWVVLKKRNN